MSTKAENLREPGSCLNKAEANEPVFILRANDPVAAQTIRLWVAMSVSTRNPDKISDALSVACEMEAWVKERNSPRCNEAPARRG